MADTNHLSDLWEHTIVKVFKHDSKSQLGLMFKQWIIFKKLENFNSILNYTIDDFTPSGNFCYMNEHGDILPYTPMKKIFNLKWYIQYLIDESKDEDQNPLSEKNWMKQNNCKFMKYVIHHRHPMTPEQLKQKPFEEIFNNQHEKVDTDEGGSTKVEEEYTTSEELTEEYSTFSDMSKQDSESDINVDDTQHPENPHTPETLQIHNIYNTTMQIKMIQYMMNMIHQNMKIYLKLKHLNNMGRKFNKQKSQYLWKHLKFLLYSTKQYIMNMIHQMTNL